MVTFLTVLQIISCFILIIAVLLQPAKGGAALGGSSQSVFGSSGGTTFLFRITLGMAAFIMVSSLVLSRYRIQEAQSSKLDALPATTVPSAAAPQPAAPGSGAAGQAAPSGPSVPNPAAPPSGQ